MNKLKNIKSILFITSITLGISLLLIHSYTPDNTAMSDDSIMLGQVSDLPLSATLEEKRDELLIKDNEDSMVTSRGSKVRDIQETTTTLAEDDTLPIVDTESNPIETKSTAVAKEEEPEPVTQAVTKPSAPVEVKVEAPPVEVKVTPPPADTTSEADKDLDLLARLITAEPQGESYDAKVAVGAVVMNRVKSSLWPNTIKEVIYQNIKGYYQFTPVVNGWIDKPATSDSIKAAKDALNGVDLTNGAQFYYDDKTTSAWMLGRPVSIKIDHMIYAY